MRPYRVMAGLAGLVMVAGLAAACGEAGQSGTEEPDPGAEGQGCAPVAGEQLVMLEDDQGLQLAENIVAAMNAEAATPEAIQALDAVAAVLDPPGLLDLKRAVDIDRQTAPEAAQDFAATTGFPSTITGGGSGELVVGTADFSESQIVAELYRLALTEAGFEAEVQTVGNRELYEPALERGEVHVMPEYLGTLTEFLNAKVNGADPELLASNDPAATRTELEALGEEVGLVFGEPAEAATQNAFAVTQEFANEYGVASLSDLAANCSGAETILGGPPECPQRPFCQPGLEETYGISFGPFSSLDAGGPLTKEALRTGQISVGLVFSSDVDLAPA